MDNARSFRRIPRFAAAVLVLASLACAGAPLANAPPQAAAGSSGAGPLRAKHQELAESLAHSPFGRPMHIASSDDGDNQKGDVYAVVNHPFATVADGLGSAAHWCDVLILPFNVKHCRASADGSQLAVRIGRKSSQPAEEAYKIDFRYGVAARSSDYLRVSLAANEGPAGTRDYHIAMEATPIDAQHTFLHLAYSYRLAGMSKVMMKTYLSTTGADKAGFTDATGMRAATERNAMRYFLAVDAYLSTLSAPEGDRLHKRLATWFAATERYPKQLHEMSEREYIAMKEKDTAKVGKEL
jgi:hypothetical protein